MARPFEDGQILGGPELETAFVDVENAADPARHFRCVAIDGLFLTIAGGVARGVWYDEAEIELNPSADNYVQLNPTTGEITLGDGEFEGGHEALFYAETDTGSVTNALEIDGAARFDRRTFIAADGADGASGTQIYSGSGAPSDGDGANGDYYLRTSNGVLYKKAAGTWSTLVTLKGADGANGTNGTNGTNGVDGDDGADGADAVIPAPYALTDGATITPDAANGFDQYVTLSGDRTLANWANLADGQMILFCIRQDATGGRTLTPGAKYAETTGVTLDGGTIPINTTALKYSWLLCQYRSTPDKIFMLDLVTE